MDVSSSTASASVRVVLVSCVVRSLGVVRPRSGSGRGVTVATSARSVPAYVHQYRRVQARPKRKYSRSGVQTALVCASLLLLDPLHLVRVGVCSLVGITIAASASGVVLGRVGGITRDAVGRGRSRIARDLFVRVTGAGAIDVSGTAAARRVL